MTKTLLTKKEYKALKKEIVENSATYVGFNCNVLNRLADFDILSVIDRAVEFGSYFSRMSDADKQNFLVTEMVKSMTYQEFKLVAPYFFNYSSLLKAILNEFLARELVDDTSLCGGVGFQGETLRDFLEECGFSIPYTFSAEWLEEINKQLEGSGILPLKR